MLRFVKSQFFDYQESTIGAAFLTKTLPDQGVKFEIWYASVLSVRISFLCPLLWRDEAHTGL